MVTIKKGDFIELNFSAYDANRIFDSTYPKDAKELGIEEKNLKPLLISVGHEMVLKGLDNDLIGKETGKDIVLELEPKDAFGKRDPKMIKVIAMKIFKEKNINPVPGMPLQLDNMVVKVISVSGGRVIVDFNNPLAGKKVKYVYNIKRIIDDDKEKIDAMQDYFFRSKFDYDYDKKTKIAVFKDKKIEPIINMFKDKFKDIVGIEIKLADSTKSV